MPIIPNADQIGSFIRTTEVWDVDEIQEVDVKSEAFKEMLVRLNIYVADMANILNIKDTGRYNTSEFVTGQVFFPNPALSSSTAQVATDRQTIRKVINFGSLPNTGTTSVPHGIFCTPKTTFTRIYGSASDTTGLNYIPLPYASPTLVNNIELKVNATDVTIITGSNRSNFNITYVILEYLQV